MPSKEFEFLWRKFPDVDKIALETCINDFNLREIDDISEAIETDKLCSACDGSRCLLPENLQRGHRVVWLDDSRGRLELRSGYTRGRGCQYDPFRGKFGELFGNSGLMKRQVYQTFETFDKVSKETAMAYVQAKTAAKGRENIILAGRAGVGKTHLATATAIYAMKENRQARFCLVNEMLDKLRDAAKYSSDYLYVINKFKRVPCLILDDLGKERTTDAGLDYLHQIIDYRYRSELQTVVTTNALNIEELSSWGNANFITPMVSRILERGEWVTISDTGDYRVRIKERKKKVAC